MMAIEIRLFNENDAPQHCEAVIKSINELKKWFTWATDNYCECDSSDFIETTEEHRKQDKYHYAIIKNGKLVGACSLTNVKTYNGEKIASMSYWKRSDRYDIMKKAAEELKQKGFNELGFDIIEIDIADCNHGSIKVAEHIKAKAQRDMIVRGGDNKPHKGKRYVLRNPKSD